MKMMIEVDDHFRDTSWVRDVASGVKIKYQKAVSKNIEIFTETQRLRIAEDE